MDNEQVLRDWMIALRTPGVGPATLREQLAMADGQIDQMLARWRRRPPSKDRHARAWLEAPDEDVLDDDLDWLARPRHRLLRYTDEDFPPQLETIPQPPCALFVSGDVSTLLRPQVAIVGARAASQGGAANARVFAHRLARAGFVVTSGLADGIDAAAHIGALEADRTTVAVVGTGPDVIYPRKNRQLYDRIRTHGVLVSEFPPGTEARADHFPRRNRIIAGLALGTVVVEAGLQSGSLITARLAAEQGREVFALPGSIHNPLARGCHRLIRDGVRLVESAPEIIEPLVPAARAMGTELARRLKAAAGNTRRRRRSRSRHVDEESQRLLDALGHDPVGLDELAERTGDLAAGLSSMLLMLELEGYVECLPGGRYQRLPGR